MIRATAILGLVSLWATALAAVEVQTSHKSGVDYAAFETYAWKPRADHPPDHPLAEGSPLDRLIREAGDEVLAAAGLEIAAAGEADLWVSYVGFVTDHLTVEGVRKEIAEGVAWIGVPQAHHQLAYKEGTLVIEIQDAASGDLIWSGWASNVARTTDKLRRKAERVARRILRRFPPR